MGWIVFSSETGAEIRRTETEPVLEAGEASAVVSAASGAVWSPALRGWLDPVRPRQLSGLQILALYTPAQHARLRRMLFATHPALFPVGHPQAGQPNPLAGQLVDPEAMVQRLADATLAMQGTIAVTDPLHVNGTAFYRAVGVIETDIEAVRISAGITPEEWAAGVRP